jgi:type VI secretion system (T6SS) effector TldE1-like protein
MFTYESSTGRLFDPNQTFMASGYAGGDKGLHKEGINNPAYEQVHNVGPLPQGLYTMGIPVEGSHLGPLAIPLIPDPNNQMFGRSDFFVHGDHIGAPGTASDGCMIFAHDIRTLLSKSDERQIQVIAVRGE